MVWARADSLVSLSHRQMTCQWTFYDITHQHPAMTLIVIVGAMCQVSEEHILAMCTECLPGMYKALEGKREGQGGDRKMNKSK